MMPTLTVIATAVASAAVKTEVRPNDARKDRRASKASTPRIFSIARFAVPAKHATMPGIAVAALAITSIAAKYAKSGWRPIGGNCENAAAAVSMSAAQMKAGRERMAATY